MDSEKVSKALEKFISSHKSDFYELPRRDTALFEIVGLVATTEKLKKRGFSVATENLKSGKFRVKTTSSGNPNNFSHFSCTKKGRSFEVHANLMVKGAHDEGRYVVDVAVVKASSVPVDIKKVSSWEGVDNKYLISFAEVKKMVAFPMLLAQFIGIVHEIMPRYLKPLLSGKPRKALIPPALMVQRYASPNCKAIVRNLPSRGICLSVDSEAAMMLWNNIDDEF